MGKFWNDKAHLWSFWIKPNGSGELNQTAFLFEFQPLHLTQDQQKTWSIHFTFSVILKKKKKRSKIHLYIYTQKRVQLTATLLQTTKRWRCSHGRSPPAFHHSHELCFGFFLLALEESRPKQTGPAWKSLRKAASTGEHLDSTLHSIFEDKGHGGRERGGEGEPLSWWHYVGLSGCMAPWKTHRGCTGPGARQAGYILHIWPGESRDEKDGAARETQIRRAGRRKAVTFSIRRPWDMIGRGLLSLVSLPTSCFPPSLTDLRWHARPWPPPQRGAQRVHSVRVCVCVCAVLEPASGRPRPRICCGSVQWTGARQDVTFWRKLSGHHRAKRLSLNVLCPAHLTDRLKRTVRIKSSPSFLGQYQLWT